MFVLQFTAFQRELGFFSSHFPAPIVLYLQKPSFVTSPVRHKDTWSVVWQRGEANRLIWEAGAKNVCLDHIYTSKKHSSGQMFKRCKCVLPRQIINSYRVEQQVYGLSLLLLTVQVCDLTNTDIYLAECKWIVLNFIWILSRYKTLEMTSGDGALEGKAHVSFILVTASFHLILSVRSGTKSHCYSTGTCAFPSLSTAFTISAGKKHFKIMFLSL